MLSALWDFLWWVGYVAFIIGSVVVVLLVCIVAVDIFLERQEKKRRIQTYEQQQQTYRTCDFGHPYTDTYGRQHQQQFHTPFKRNSYQSQTEGSQADPMWIMDQQIQYISNCGFPSFFLQSWLKAPWPEVFNQIALIASSVQKLETSNEGQSGNGFPMDDYEFLTYQQIQQQNQQRRQQKKQYPSLRLRYDQNDANTVESDDLQVQSSLHSLRQLCGQGMHFDACCKVNGFPCYTVSAPQFLDGRPVQTMLYWPANGNKAGSTWVICLSSGQKDEVPFKITLDFMNFWSSSVSGQYARVLAYGYPPLSNNGNTLVYQQPWQQQQQEQICVGWLQQQQLKWEVQEKVSIPGWTTTRPHKTSFHFVPVNQKSMVQQGLMNKAGFDGLVINKISSFLSYTPPQEDREQDERHWDLVGGAREWDQIRQEYEAFLREPIGGPQPDNRGPFGVPLRGFEFGDFFADTPSPEVIRARDREEVQMQLHEGFHNVDTPPAAIQQPATPESDIDIIISPRAFPNGYSPRPAGYGQQMQNSPQPQWQDLQLVPRLDTPEGLRMIRNQAQAQLQYQQQQQFGQGLGQGRAGGDVDHRGPEEIQLAQFQDQVQGQRQPQPQVEVGQRTPQNQNFGNTNRFGRGDFERGNALR